MSGSAGGNRIPRSAVEKTVQEYIDKVLSKVPGFKSARVSGSYNTSAKEDFGDIDLITSFEGEDKKEFKKQLAKYLESLPDDVIVPFKSEKYRGKKTMNTGEIVTILYPIAGMPGEFVQVDNIIALSEEEGDFKKTFLDYPAEIQGLILGLVKVVTLEEDPNKVIVKMGVKNIPALEPNQEYEFNLSSAGLTLRIVTLDQDYKQLDRTEVWKSSNWSDVKKLLSDYNINQSFKDLVSDLKKLKNPRSKNRIKGIFKSMVSIKSGEVNTPKGDNKQMALDTVATLEEKYGSFIVDLIRPILEAEIGKQTIAVFPGAFKPPHASHLKAIQVIAPKVDKVYVYVSKQPRVEEGQVPIDASQAMAVWELYKEKGLIPSNVEIKLAQNPTPVLDAYQEMEAHPENKYLAVFGKDEEDRWKSVEKNREKYGHVTPVNIGNLKGLSASGLRTAIKNKDLQAIETFLPEEVTVKEYIQALSKGKKEDLTEAYKGKKTNNGAPGTFKAKITKAYGGDVTIEKARKFKSRENATALDKQQANWFINFHSKNENINELVTDTEVICDNCGWTWKIADGGDDLYICHNTLPSGGVCGHNNDPDLFEAPNPEAGSAIPYGSGYRTVEKNLNEALYSVGEPADAPIQTTPSYAEVEQELKPYITELVDFMVKQGLNITPVPRIEFVEDEENAKVTLGRTAYYDPNNKVITLYVTRRHPKDVLRSFAHEMIHHMQNLEGRLENMSGTTNVNEDGYLANIEREAYDNGNMIFRSWENDREGNNSIHNMRGFTPGSYDMQPITEGAYNSVTRQVVKDIMAAWKEEYTGQEDTLSYDDEYETQDAKGRPLDFILSADLLVKETEEGIYKVDGGADAEVQDKDDEDDPDFAYLEIRFQVDPRSLPQFWSRIYADLTDVVRHEIEHLTQLGVNVVTAKELPDDKILRQMIDWELLPKADYFRLQTELDPMLQGMYLKAKKTRTPFKDVLNDYLDMQNITPEDKENILGLWRKRLKALSLPQF